MRSNETAPSHRLLIAEDDGYCYFFLKDIMDLPGLDIQRAARDSEVFESASRDQFDAILLSFRGMIRNDLSMVRILHEDNPYAPIVAVAERGEVDFALTVLREGAFDYLIRPFQNAARVESAIINALRESERLRKAADLGDTQIVAHGMVGKSRVISEILKKCAQIAPLNVNVLISGESGTGKELIARAIHGESQRNKAPFVPVNCGAIPDGLMESIFFGHEKGAFTGAVQSHTGIMEKGDGGTVFLDEIGELSPKGQVTLLRFMEDRQFTKVGGVKIHTADVRIIAATNRDLEKGIDKNEFRTDLFYRLNVVNFKAPPLRHRTEDIVPLADHFLKRFCLVNDLRPINISSQAAGVLVKYPWPGNVRELENLMEGLAAVLPLDRNVITSEDVLSYSGKIRKSVGASDSSRTASLHEKSYKEAQRDFEKQYFKDILAASNGNVSQAARQAGIHPVTLHRKLKTLRLGNYGGKSGRK